MCQLIYVNLHQLNLNRLAAFNLSYYASVDNKDGYGIYTAGRIYKTEIPPIKMGNLGTIIRDNIKSESPVMLHCRLASRGIAVKTENIHPFESKDLILMHNGTLYGLKEHPSDTREESRESDSKEFLVSLQEEYGKEKNFVKALQTTMKERKGKFAFLIYNKIEKQFYAIRGRTADLHIAYVKFAGEERWRGYVILTKKLDLEVSLFNMSNMSQMLGGGELEYKIEELKQETIFKCEEFGVVECGSIPETSAYVTTNSSSRWDNYDDDGTWLRHPWVSKQHVDNVPNQLPLPPYKATLKSDQEYEDAFEVIYEWMTQNKIPIGFLETIFSEVFGIAFYQLQKEDLQTFIEYVIPQTKVPKKLRKWIEGNSCPTLPPAFYERFQLQFPLGANRDGLVSNPRTANQIAQCIRTYKKENDIK